MSISGENSDSSSGFFLIMHLGVLRVVALVELTGVVVRGIVVRTFDSVALNVLLAAATVVVFCTFCGTSSVLLLRTCSIVRFFSPPNNENSNNS